MLKYEFHWTGQLIDMVERNHDSLSFQDTRIKKIPNSSIMIYLSQLCTLVLMVGSIFIS